MLRKEIQTKKKKKKEKCKCKPIGFMEPFAIKYTY